MLYSKEGFYYNSTEIDRRIHNVSGFMTTGLTASQINILKANFGKDLKH